MSLHALKTRIQRIECTGREMGHSLVPMLGEPLHENRSYPDEGVVALGASECTAQDDIYVTVMAMYMFVRMLRIIGDQD
jgi:hypothetical protein